MENLWYANVSDLADENTEAGLVDDETDPVFGDGIDQVSI